MNLATVRTLFGSGNPHGGPMNRFVLRFALIGAVLVGCAASSKTDTPRPVSTPCTGIRSLRVSNQLSTPVDVYVQAGGGATFLSTVQPGSSELAVPDPTAKSAFAKLGNVVVTGPSGLYNSAAARVTFKWECQQAG